MTSIEAAGTSCDRGVLGSIFLHRAETTTTPRVESSITFVLWHREDIVDDGMRLIMRLCGEDPRMRGVRLFWHKGC
jgi:hypothetical protein